MRSSLLLAGSSLATLCFATFAYAQSSTETYEYDSLGRLVKVVTEGGQNDAETQSICYDEADNRTQYLANTSDGVVECSQGSGGTPTPSPTPTPPPPPPPGNNPPDTTDDFVSGTCSSTGFTNLIANDSDPENNTPLVLTNIVKNSGGSDVAIISGGLVEVFFASSAGDFSHFTYTVEDSLGASSTGELNVATSTCGGGGLPF